MKIIIPGGTGLIGGKLVNLFRSRGHAVVRRYLVAHHDPRTVVTDEQAPYFGTTHEKRSLVPEGENPLIGSTYFADWLSP